MSKGKTSRLDLESAHQQALFKWASFHPIAKDYLISIPNGGHRHISVARKLKAEGLKRGVSDIFLAYPMAPYAGLWIELKAPVKSAKVSIYQRQWLDKMSSVGYCSYIAYGWEKAIKAILSYLGSREVYHEDEFRGQSEHAQSKV